MSDTCPIWGTQAEDLNLPYPDILEFDSPRTFGRFVITRYAIRDLDTKYRLDNRLRARLTSWLIEERSQGIECSKITESTLNIMESRRDASVHERADRLLRALELASTHIGSGVWWGEQFEQWGLMACSECINKDELNFLLRFMESQSWIEEIDREKFAVTVQGYARLESLQARPNASMQVFVAMWFDPSMEQVYEKGIKLGIEDSGYKSVRIDKKEHNNKIDDEIIAEIKRSRFIVADFTQKPGDARGGVYYEAGFAHGLGIPVIFCCRKDAINEVHFDTRQYKHILWSTPEELREQLTLRIAAVIDLRSS